MDILFMTGFWWLLHPKWRKCWSLPHEFDNLTIPQFPHLCWCLLIHFKYVSLKVFTWFQLFTNVYAECNEVESHYPRLDVPGSEYKPLNRPVWLSDCCSIIFLLTAKELLSLSLNLSSFQTYKFFKFSVSKVLLHLLRMVKFFQ